MHSRVLAAAICMGVSSVALAQHRWTRTYGGTHAAVGNSVQQTADGYIVAGYIDASGDSDQVYLVKADAFGDTIWTRTFGGLRDDAGLSVRQTRDGGYIVTGYTFSYGAGGQDVYLLKLDASGDTAWTRTYGGAGIDVGYSVQQTSDTGYIIGGVTTSFGNGQQVYLIKTNAAGDTMWTRVFGGTYMDAAYSVQQTNDGGYVLGGISSSFGSFDAYVVKTNASGDTIWTRTYGGSSTEFGQSIQQTQDSGYIVSGYSVSFGDSSQVYLVKTNVSGDTMWTRTYGGARNEDGYSVRQTQDGGYIVAGATNSFGAGLQDVYLLRLNASGDTLWTRTYGGSSTDVGKSVQQTSDMGYIVAGHSSSYGAMQVYLIKTDAEGNAWVEESHQPQTPDSRIRATLVLGMLCLPGGQSVGSSPSWLLDIDGRKVLDLAPGANDVSHLATGVYFVQFGRGEFSRVVVVR